MLSRSVIHSFTFFLVAVFTTFTLLRCGSFSFNLRTVDLNLGDANHHYSNISALFQTLEDTQGEYQVLHFGGSWWCFAAAKQIPLSPLSFSPDHWEGKREFKHQADTDENFRLTEHKGSWNVLQHIPLSLACVGLVLYLRLSKGVCILVGFYDTDVLHILLSYIFLFIYSIGSNNGKF